ncbi:MAG: PAS domain S-box protein [Chloroflexi bacterium]|nr:PAS domain S-box protein [Chloroflexota bacterium]
MYENQDQPIYAAIFHALPDPLIIFDSEGMVVDINNSFTKTYGFSKEDVQGINMVNAELVTNETKKTLMKNVERLLNGEDCIPYRMTIFNKDGGLNYAELNLSVFIHDGEYTNVAVLRNITQRKKAEDELKEAYHDLEQQIKVNTNELEKTNRVLADEILVRKQVEQALRKSPTSYSDARDAIILFLEDKSLVGANKKFIELSEYPKTELIFKRLGDFFPDDLAPISGNKIKQIKDDSSIPPFETTLITKNRKHIRVEVSIGLLVNCQTYQRLFESAIREIKNRQK